MARKETSAGHKARHQGEGGHLGADVGGLVRPPRPAGRKLRQAKKSGGPPKAGQGPDRAIFSWGPRTEEQEEATGKDPG